MPKHSICVVIPAYNREHSIRKALDSVLAQTYPATQIIVVDDGSKDDTCKVVQQYKTVTLIKQKNAGPAAARNTALRKAKTDFVALLDSDDYWDATKLEKQIALYDGLSKAEQNKVGLIDTYNQIMRDDKVINRYSMDKAGDVLQQMLYNNVVNSTSSVLIPTHVIKEIGVFDSTYDGAEDRDLWLRIAEKYDYYTVPEYLTTMIHAHDNISANYNKTMVSKKLLLDAAFKRNAKTLDQTKQDKIRAYNMAIYLPQMARNLRVDQFRELFGKCWQLDKRFVLSKKGKYLLLLGFSLLGNVGFKILYGAAGIKVANKVK